MRRHVSAFVGAVTRVELHAKVSSQPLRTVAKSGGVPMDIFRRLFWPRKRPNENLFAIPIGPDDPPDMQILAKPRARPPRRRGRTPKQIAADELTYVAAIRERAQASYRLDRDRAAGVGSRMYIWETCKDADVCSVCAARQGKRYSWAREPKHGPPGYCDACPCGYCRCLARPILPEFD